MANPQATGFTNLANILQANRSNQLGQTIQSGVQSGIQNINNQIGQSQGQFQTGVNQANLATQPNQQYVSGMIANIANSIPPANVNAPQGQTAPTAPTNPATMTQQPTAPSAPTVSSTTAPAAPKPTPVSSQTPATSSPQPTATSATDLSTLPGSFGFASTPTSGASQTQMTGQGFNAPTSGDISKFSQYLQGGYAGPTQLQNINTIQGQAQNLQNATAQMNTPGGLQSLLQRYVGGPGYTQGQQTLDTILLGQTGYPSLQNIARATQNIANVPQAAEAQAAAQAAQAALANQQFAQSIRSQLSGAESPILQQIQNQIQNQNTTNTAMQTAADKINSYLNTPLTKASPPGLHMGVGPGAGGLAPTTDAQAAMDALNTASQAGLINQDQLTQMASMIPTIQSSGLDMKTLLQGAFIPYTAPTSPYTMQQGATAQQAAALNALNQLAGQGQQFSTYGGLAPAQAGFDMTKFLAQIPNTSNITPAGGSQAQWNPGQTANFGNTDPLASVNTFLNNPLSPLQSTTGALTQIGNYLNPTTWFGGGGGGGGSHPGGFFNPQNW